MRFSFDKKRILEQIDCGEDSPVFQQAMEELEDFLEEAENLLEPDFYYQIGTWEYQEWSSWTGPVIYGSVTIGGKISEKSNHLFQTGDYLRGMLADAVADAALMQAEEHMLQQIRQECMEKNYGILGRLEAPLDIPMEAQKVIMDHLEIPETRITALDSFMLKPSKSMCFVLKVEKDKKVFCLEHDCSKCPRKDCKMRKEWKARYEIHGIIYEKQANGKENLLEEILKLDHKISAPCGGRGACGKCRILVQEGWFPVTVEDEKFFTKEQLDQGYRLACTAVPAGDFKVKWLGNSEEEMEVLTTGEFQRRNPAQKDQDASYVIAIDIGTTTLAFCAYSAENGEPTGDVAGLNHQRAFGADVVARIQASNEGQGPDLKKSIQRDLKDGLRALCLKGNISPHQVKKVVLAGNTTMIHLLMGYSCETLGVVPFTPYSVALIETDMNRLCQTEDMPFEAVILPGISAFVGGDIVSGIMAMEMDKKEKPCLLIDLGTNGEMALGNKEKILVTSTAAGPAFEGGNISCGVGSIPGAIFHVELGAEKEICTIGDKTPIGICGTGVVETVAQLVKEELVDETGLMEEDYFEEGYLLATDENGEAITFTQKDVREIQLAKAAVRAGLETLLLRYGIEDYEEVDEVYVAGGFGYKLDLKNAVGIGMFPEKLRPKMKAVGNASLAGARKYALKKFTKEEMDRMLEKAEEVSLGNDKDFQEFYMEYMMFEAI